MVLEKLNRTDKIAVDECMQLLAKSIRKIENKTDALLYFQFEDLINKTFGTSLNYSSSGKIFEDGKRRLSIWEIAKGEHLETLRIIKGSKKRK